MTRRRVTMRKESIRGGARVGFVGMGALCIPAGRGEDLVAEAHDRFDIETLPDRTDLGDVVVDDDPPHHVVKVVWNETASETETETIDGEADAPD